MLWCWLDASGEAGQQEVSTAARLPKLPSGRASGLPEAIPSLLGVPTAIWGCLG